MSESWHPRKTEKDVAVARAGVAKYDRGWKYGAGTREHDHSKLAEGGEVLKPEQTFTNSIPPSYVVYERDGTIYADAQDSSLPSLSGSSAATVIENAISEVDSVGGGKVYIKAGTYDIDNDIVIRDKSNVVVEGAGKFATTLKVTSTGYPVFNKNEDVLTEGMEFRHFGIDGNGVADSRLMNLRRKSENFVLEHLYLRDTDSGFLVGFGDSHNINVRNCIFKNAGLGTTSDLVAGYQRLDKNGVAKFTDNVFIYDAVPEASSMLSFAGGGWATIKGNVFINKTDTTSNAVSVEARFNEDKGKLIVDNKTYQPGVYSAKRARISITTDGTNPLGKYVIQGNVAEGIYVGADSTELAPKVVIADNEVKGQDGIMVYYADNVTIVGNDVGPSEYAIYGYQTNHIRIVGNVCKNYNQTETYANNKGIFVNYYGKAIILGNECYDDQATETAVRGIILAIGGGDYAAVRNNIVSDLSTPIHIATSPTDRDIEGNKGYKTRNSGSASVADGDTIAHGLDETPTYVNLTASVDGHIAVATAVDATSITVGLVDDAGSAVSTAETVYWEAEAR